MIDDKLAQCALEEVERRNWGVTGQFLEIHELLYEGNTPKIARIDTERPDGTAIVYLPVKDENFYLAIYLKLTPAIEVSGVWIESENTVYFQASSETLSVEELCVLTSLEPTARKKKGVLKTSGRGINKTSSIRFEPNPEPDEFEDKLKKLLDFLESDAKGVNQLVEQANGYIHAVIDAHNGNGIIGGPNINKTTIKRMAALNLAIDISIQASGNSWL